MLNHEWLQEERPSRLASVSSVRTADPVASPHARYASARSSCTRSSLCPSSAVESAASPVHSAMRAVAAAAHRISRSSAPSPNFSRMGRSVAPL